MRIGNLEDMEKQKPANPASTEAPEAPYDVRADSPRRKKFKNWWYYYKWYVIAGIVLLAILCHIAGNALGLWQKAPDFQVAYVGKQILPQDTISALEQAFTSVAEDFNKDGEVIVQINQYIYGTPNPDAETAYYEYASETSLIGDISSADSYFFLMDEPEHFQLEYQLLASPDGSCPDESDFSIDGKAIAWADCPALSVMELGTYSATILGVEETGSNQELLSGLYLGRRCFYTDKTTDYADECGRLWDYLFRGQ